MLECSNFVLAKMGGHKMIGHSFLVCFYVVYGDAESPPILPSVGILYLQDLTDTDSYLLTKVQFKMEASASDGRKER
jgi:hypothetical protein